MDGQMDGGMNRPTDGPTEGPTDRRTNGWTYGWMHQRTDRRMEGPTDGQTDRWMDGQTDGPTDEYRASNKNKHLPLILKESQWKLRHQRDQSFLMLGIPTVEKIPVSKERYQSKRVGLLVFFKKSCKK